MDKENWTESKIWVRSIFKAREMENQDLNTSRPGGGPGDILTINSYLLEG